MEDFLYPSIEAFNHTVGLGGFRGRQTMFDVQSVAEPVKIVRMRIGQALSGSRRNRLALAAVLVL